MALEITLAGLESDNYLFNNPIWIDCSNLGGTARWLSVQIARTDDPSKNVNTRLYVNSTTVSLDISEYVKGLTDYPAFPEGVILNGDDILTNYQEFNIILTATNSVGQTTAAKIVTRTFIRGGLEKQTTNNYLPDQTLLKESTKIPYWFGYELRRYRIDTGVIVMEDNIPFAEYDRMPIVGCNPLYLKWLNMLGGYSYWLFENWDVEKATEKTNVIQRRSRDISTGHKSTYSLTVESRIDRKYFKHIRSLIQSPEVYVYDLSGKIDGISGLMSGGAGWEQIWNNGNSSSINAIKKLENIKLKFDYVLKHKTETIW